MVSPCYRKEELCFQTRVMTQKLHEVFLANSQQSQHPNHTPYKKTPRSFTLKKFLYYQLPMSNAQLPILNYQLPILTTILDNE